MAEGGDRPPSRNADMQTEPVKEFPPLLDMKARKTLRTNEKRRLTNLSKRIEQHMNDLGSRTELKFLRKELSNQLEECIKAHNLYRQSFNLAETPSDDWIIQLENVTAMWYGRIDEYIRTVNRPPSTAPSNTRSIAHSNPLSVRSNPTSMHSNPLSVRSSAHSNAISVHNRSVSAHGIPVSIHNSSVSVHSNPVSAVQSDQASFVLRRSKQSRVLRTKRSKSVIIPGPFRHNSRSPCASLPSLDGEIQFMILKQSKH
uniref:Uncharacterized protein n=1 Tax=Daphnia galeata TaxID=27404 RepID=A0A8J2WPB0_9CRUS|nr:unnamed protein product [Daphnia galeata]